MADNSAETSLAQPIAIPCDPDRLDALLATEWLVANKLGSYASGTVVGCNTRRYHNLLVAATNPPVGRVACLSSLMEQLIVDGETYDLAANEFDGVFYPTGFAHLKEFRNELTPTFVYRCGKFELTKQIILAETENAVAVRYTLKGGAGELVVSPFVSLRDFHHLRRKDDSNKLAYELSDSGLTVQDHAVGGDKLHLQASAGKFYPDPNWWYKFHYRIDQARGQDCFEDLYTPGQWRIELSDSGSADISGSFGTNFKVDFDAEVAKRQQRMSEIVASVGPKADETTRRLAESSDAFVVRRSFPKSSASTTILAGFHWFADWGRDTFIALPGLLLSTKRFAQARETFLTFSRYISNGMVPNRFDDYATSAHYNSIDASLWFIIAADRYVEATDDMDFWRDTLMPAVTTILTGYRDGTDFGIAANADGLLTGGSEKTQLTWMDAALGDEIVTPRHGLAVEINALWYAAHRIVAHRCKSINHHSAEDYAAQAELIGAEFNNAFWNAKAGCLYDCITEQVPDDTIRPNQIFAVSLPHSPLPPEKQAAVVSLVQEKLLTPMGLRTLSPDDPRYRPHYDGSWADRDRAYHQGTAWAWLMGPFIEAYLKVNKRSSESLAQASSWLEGFDEHIRRAGVGYISEIFDGDPPHTPRGCIAQAWSVAEILRAKLLVQSDQS